ncbi:GNAT family N-acetyltransferase [Psychromarinibacter sp. S121]|uniref:GNAT family N-acetyltransferase n=1 Tax=Psychromarinibacter sp. S121 TaxID=3415127 RepID=UPI003C7A5AEB
MEIRWDSLTERAWTAALSPNAGALQQSWRYGAAVQAMGGTVRRAELWHGGCFLGLAQVVVRRVGPLRLGWLSRGPVWHVAQGDTCAALHALRRALPGGGPRLLLCVAEGRVPGTVPLVTPVCMAEVPLAPEPAIMRCRLHQKWRNRLVKAEAAGLKVSVTAPSAADLDWLLSLDRAQAKTRGYRGLPPAFLAAWTACKGPPPRLFTARLKGDTVAAMLFLDHAPGATYHIGWNGPEGRAVSAHHLLLWQAMRHFARHGRARLDLGPLDTVNAPGLARFKLGTGATARWLGPTALVPPWRRETSCKAAQTAAMLAEPYSITDDS